MVRLLKSITPITWLLLFAAGLRLPTIASESLWYDETFTALVAKLPLERFWTAVRGDVHPPLYYVLQWINVRLFGDSALALRLPSALLGVLAVYLLYRLVLALEFSPRIALLASTFVAVLPAMIYYSQEARMYTLLLCCILGAAWAAIDKRWPVFGACCVGASYAQNLGVFYVASLGLIVLFVQFRQADRWRALVKPFFTLVTVAGLWLPWLVFGLMHQMENVNAGFWMQPLSAGGVFEPLYYMTILIRPRPELTLAAYLAIAALSIVSMIKCRKWLLTERGLIISSVLFGAPALIALVSVVWRSVYLPRAMIASIAAMAICWAYTLVKLRIPDRRAALVVVAPALVVGLVGYYFPNQGARYPWDEKAQLVQSAWQPGDVLFYASINAAITLHYYFPARYPYALRHEAGDLNQSLTPETQDAMQLRELEFDQLAAQGYRRAWLVVDINPMSTASEIAYVARVLGSYPHSMFIHYEQYASTQFNQDSIYLVNLNRSF